MLLFLAPYPALHLSAMLFREPKSACMYRSARAGSAQPVRFLIHSDAAMGAVCSGQPTACAQLPPLCCRLVRLPCIPSRTLRRQLGFVQRNLLVGEPGAELDVAD